MASWLPNPYKIIILGSGISGLSAAHTILKYAKVPCQITILEAQNRVGGWLESTRYDDGTVVEHGPRSARSTGSVALDALSIISDLNIDDKIIGVPSSCDAAKRRFIYVNGKIHTLPNSVWTVLKRQDPFSKSLFSVVAREAFVKRSRSENDESVFDFFSRRFGNEIARYMGDPLCRGIFGGDARKLSLRSCFPILYEYERNHGAVIRGMLFSRKPKRPSTESSLVQKAKSESWVSWSMLNGIHSLPEIWAEHIRKKGVDIILNAPVNSVNATADNTIQCVTSNGTFEADRIISALPLPPLVSILHNYDSRLSSLLNSIKYGNMAVISLEYEPLTNPFSGFGFLVPSSEPVDILGMTFDSQVFPQHSKSSTVLTAMSGGAWFEELHGCPDTADASKITEIAIKSAHDILSIKETPKRTICKIHKECIPQYETGHAQRVQQIKDYVKANNLPILLVGNAWGGVGVNDSIVSARNDTLMWMASEHIY